MALEDVCRVCGLPAVKTIESFTIGADRAAQGTGKLFSFCGQHWLKLNDNPWYFQTPAQEQR